MPNLTSVLKTEISRLARKEIKSALDPFRQANAAQRRDIAELKRNIASLQRELKAASKISGSRTAQPDKPTIKTTVAPAGLKSLRARLGLSARDFGLLVAASGQSIYNWGAGKTVPRQSQQAALAAIRGQGKREAARRLEAMN